MPRDQTLRHLEKARWALLSTGINAGYYGMPEEGPVDGDPPRLEEPEPFAADLVREELDATLGAVDSLLEEGAEVEEIADIYTSVRDMYGALQDRYSDPMLEEHPDSVNDVPDKLQQFHDVLPDSDGREGLAAWNLYTAGDALLSAYRSLD